MFAVLYEEGFLRLTLEDFCKSKFPLDALDCFNQLLFLRKYGQVERAKEKESEQKKRELSVCIAYAP